MKKYIVLFGVTALVVTVILLVGFTTGNQAVEVTPFPLQEQTAEFTVSCDGVVQSVHSYEVYADYTCVIDRVAVRQGDRVKKGDTLLTADAENTRKLLAASGNWSTEQIERIAAYRVTAPANGIVTAVNVADGELTDSKKPSFEIGGTDALQVTVGIAEKDLRQVKVGQSARVAGKGFARDSYNGSVTQISSVARTVNGKTVVEAIVTLYPEEHDTSLRIGLTADVRIVTETKERCVCVPYDLIEQDEEQNEYVYVIENDKAVKRTIVTGESVNDGVWVKSGLSAADVLVANPQDIAKDGVSVKVRAEA